MTPAQVERLRAAVQHNCDIADARHAADLPLCQFLLQMRELYRWRHGLDYATVPPRDAVGRWLAEREQAWDDLEAQSFATLPLGGDACDPFDLERINRHLAPYGWVYGAGHVDAGRPGFFLAVLLRAEAGPPAVQHCGRELARGLFAPPAALQGGHTIVLRRDALARWLWMLWEGFALQRPEGALAALLRAHGVHDMPTFIATLPRLTDVAAEVLLLHEHGEARAGAWLEPRWTTLRAEAVDRRTGLALRALRDLIADCDVTLPALLDAGYAAGLHFWFATFEGMRAALLPEASEAYACWHRHGDVQPLRQACAAGRDRCAALAQELLALPDAPSVARRIAALLAT